MRRMQSPSEISLTEKENGSNAYIMTLVAAIAGLPLPIINLIACIIFAASLGKKSDFVKYHILQATLSQLALVLMNSVLFTWTVRIIFTDLEATPAWGGYLAAALVINLMDFIANIRAAIAARKGLHFSMAFFGWLSWAIVYSGAPRDGELPADESPRAPKAILQLILLIAIFIAVFFTVKTLSPGNIPASGWLSTNKEIELGEKLTKLILKEEDRITSKECRNFTDTIKNRLQDANAPSDYNYRLYVIRKNEINAITLPGGNIIIYSGLIEAADSPEEVAGVIAHETGHVERHHVVRRLIREVGIAIVIAAAGGSGGEYLASLAQTVVGNTFNRGQEHEADEYGLQSLEKAGIDPVVLGTFFRKVQENSDNAEFQEWTEFISTHPTDESRIDFAFAYKVKPGFRATPLPREDFDALKEQLNSN